MVAPTGTGKIRFWVLLCEVLETLKSKKFFQLGGGGGEEGGGWQAKYFRCFVRGGLSGRRRQRLNVRTRQNANEVAKDGVEYVDREEVLEKRVWVFGGDNRSGYRGEARVQRENESATNVHTAKPGSSIQERWDKVMWGGSGKEARERLVGGSGGRGEGEPREESGERGGDYSTLTFSVSLPFPFFGSFSSILGRWEGSFPRMVDLMNAKNRSPYSCGGTADIICWLGTQSISDPRIVDGSSGTHRIVLQPAEEVFELLHDAVGC